MIHKARTIALARILVRSMIDANSSDGRVPPIAVYRDLATTLAPVAYAGAQSTYRLGGCSSFPLGEPSRDIQSDCQD
jgi:hypothetical protein